MIAHSEPPEIKNTSTNTTPRHQVRISLIVLCILILIPTHDNLNLANVIVRNHQAGVTGESNSNWHIVMLAARQHLR